MQQSCQTQQRFPQRSTPLLRDIESMTKGKRNSFIIRSVIIRLPAAIMPARAARAEWTRRQYRCRPGPVAPRSLAAVTAILLALLPPLPGAFGQSGYQAQNPYGTPYGKTHPFVESIQLMMDAMKGAGSPGQTGSWGTPPLDWSQYAPSQGWPGFGGSGFPAPWSASQLPGQQQMQQMMRGMGSSYNLPFPSPSLDGVWRGRAGEILVIQGNRFRVYADSTRFTEGELRIQGNELWLHNPKSNTTQRYEYAEHEGRLALRDAQGQLLLYRRTDTQGQR